jgi:hypothetical protein
MYCKDCKYWNTDDSEIYLGLGKCQSVMEFWKAREYNEEFEEVFKREAKNIKAFAADGDSYCAYLLTKENFGCVDFKAKEIDSSMS